MTTVTEFWGWMKRDFDHWAPSETHVLELPVLASRKFDDVPAKHNKVKFQIFTDANCYQISAREADVVDPNSTGSDGYLGCQVSSRKPRAGEDWTRGNDLPDGPLSEETWREILAAIVSYEIVRVHRSQVVPIDPKSRPPLSEEPVSGPGLSDSIGIAIDVT